MSKFKVGDKVKVLDASGDTGATLNEIVTVVDLDPSGLNAPGDWDGLISVRKATGETYSMFDHRFELVAEDFEAKYNALVADLLAALKAGTLYPLVNQFVPEPKPEYVDVTVRIPAGAASIYTTDFHGYPVQGQTEVTE